MLVHTSAVATVQDLVDRCAEAAPDPTAGVRCALVGGAPGDWVLPP
ncbi:MAG: hypothetical protein R3F59_34495 [Myxococcota bacterium]